MGRGGPNGDRIKHSHGLIGRSRSLLLHEMHPYTWFFRSLLIREAYRINDEMPDKMVNLIRRSLDKKELNLAGSRILLLGMTYKENVPDLRESKSLKLARYLLCKGVSVAYCDPVFASRQAELYPGPGRELERTVWVETITCKSPNSSQASEPFYLVELDLDKAKQSLSEGKFECVVLFADHAQFRDLYKELVSLRNLTVVDTRNAIEGALGKGFENVFALGRA